MLAPNSSDRRNNIFRFHTLLELLENYSHSLSALQMEAVIRDSARGFVEREWASEQETRLQFIKKCEYVMEALLALRETVPRSKMT